MNHMILHENYQGAIPVDYRVVHRWIDRHELALWTAPISHVPSGLGAAGRLYVTAAGAPKPAGTGPYRVEFAVPTRMLYPAAKATWLQILGAVENTPVFNLRVSRPSH
jgi:hypothetical protein